MTSTSALISTGEKVPLDVHRKCADYVREEPDYSCAADCPAMRFAVIFGTPEGDHGRVVLRGTLSAAEAFAASPKRIVSLAGPSWLERIEDGLQTKLAEDREDIEDVELEVTSFEGQEVLGLWLGGILRAVVEPRRKSWRAIPRRSEFGPLGELPVGDDLDVFAVKVIGWLRTVER